MKLRPLCESSIFLADKKTDEKTTIPRRSNLNQVKVDVQPKQLLHVNVNGPSSKPIGQQDITHTNSSAPKSLHKSLRASRSTPVPSGPTCGLSSVVPKPPTPSSSLGSVVPKPLSPSSSLSSVVPKPRNLPLRV
eukprot:5898_1